MLWLVIDHDARTNRFGGTDGGTGLRLEVLAGPLAGRTFPVAETGTLIIGRSPDAQVVIDDRALSRNHFAVEGRAGRFFAVDLGSANGTLLEGAVLEGRRLLSDGDQLRAGHSDFVVHIPRPKPPRKKILSEVSAVQRRRIRCEQCDRVVVMDRATILVDDDGHLVPQPDADFVCKECRENDDGLFDVQFPGYKTLDIIGEGNMGSIYLVEREDGGVFALKCLRPDTRLSDQDAARFLREASALNALQHPNIVGFVDQGHLENELFLVMEYVEGVDLDLYRRQAGGRIALERCVDLVGQVLDGLEYAHRQGFVHRDIKPANILVGVIDGHMTPKITDFGLAKRYTEELLDPITRGHISFGTPDYMPPEQITSFKDIGPRSDLFSVGATLYHLLSGETLYQGVAGPDPIRTLLEQEPPPLEERAAWLPEPICQVVNKAISRKPTDRWSTAAAFRDALLQALRLS